MRTEREHRVRVGFKIEPAAKEHVYEYVSKSAHCRDIGLAVGDLFRFGSEVVGAGLTLREAAEALRILSRDPKLRRQVRRVLTKQTGKALDEKLAALLGNSAGKANV